MQTIAIAIHKGGTSKSTTAFNLAHELAGSGRRVLLVDLDYQSSLTAMAGLADCQGKNITQVMSGALSMRVVIKQLWPNLAIVPSDIELADTELALTARIGRENILSKALASLDGFDVAILDCPPSLSVMTINALAAADAVIVPLQPTQTDVRALDLFLATFEAVKAVINPALQLMGVVLTFYDARYGLHGDVVRKLEGANVPILARIGRSVKIAEATGGHVSLNQYDPGNPQVDSYRQLTQAVMKWLKDHR